MFEWIMDPNAWLALGTLTILEIVLGIDNIIFLSLVVAKLPKAQQNKSSPARSGRRHDYAPGAVGLHRLGDPLDAPAVYRVGSRHFRPRSDPAVGGCS